MEIPEYYNEYMGSKVYGNILDYYDNPTYNIKMYMVRDMAKFNKVNELGYALNPTDINIKKDVVVLAQTGVTGVQIDNLQISGFMKGTTTTTKVAFNVIQPGAATFLDQIMIAKAYLGMPQSVTTPFIIDIRFQGYTPSGDDSDPEGGEFKVIAGPYRWMLTMTKLEVEIDENGSQYSVEAFPISQIGQMNESYYTLPKDITTRGKTITEHIKVLETEMNSHFKEASVASNNQVRFDMSNLVASDGKLQDGLDLLTNDKVLSSSDIGTDQMNRIVSDVMETIKADKHASEVINLNKYTGTEPEKQRGEDAITFKQGTSVDQVLATLLSMNDEMYQKITRRKEPFNAESDIDTSKAYTSWFKVMPDTELGPYNPEFKDFDMTFTFAPQLYRIMSTNVAYDPKENQVTKSDAEARAKQVVAASNFHKHYEYIFTGRNTDILSLDLKFEYGMALLASPRGGMIGSVSTAAANVLAPRVKVNEDVTTEGFVNEKVKETQVAKEKEAIKDAFSKITKLKEDMDSSLSGKLDKLIGDIVNSVADTLKLPADMLQSALNAGDEAVTKLLDSANPQNLSAVAGGLSNAIKPPVPATEAPNLATFKPELSAYVYGADIVADPEEAMTAEELAALGYVPVDVAKESMTQEPAKADAKTQPNPVEAATVVMGDSRNTLFGNYANQTSADQAFLAMIDLQLRGDPWYLGAGGLTPNIKKSNKYGGYFGTDTQSFWLTIRAPQVYDADVEDEDNNTGYWKFGGTSQTFSGLYNMLKVEQSFSGGIYIVDLTAHRSLIGPDKLDAKSGGSDENDPDGEVILGDADGQGQTGLGLVTVNALGLGNGQD